MDDNSRSRPTSRTLDENSNPRSHQGRRMHEDAQGSRLPEYPEEAAHQFGGPIQSSNLGYQPEYSSSGSHRQQHQSFSPYTPNMLYGIPQTSTVPSSHYGSISAFPTHRQNAAIEVLSSQFAGVQQYYVPNEASGASIPTIATTHQQSPPQSQYPPISYGQPSTGQRLPHSFTSSIHDLTQPTPAADSVAEGEFGQQNQSPGAFDEAYNRYQTALRGTFQNMRDGRLGEAGASLLVLSDWLLTNAVDLVLGLVRDEQDLQADRTRLWNEFNICWLSVLAKEKEMIREMTSTGQPPQPPREIIREDSLERMGSELVRLCDGMERHGLVDYQMGVWEEEILESITECLDMLEAHYGPRHSQPSSSSVRTSLA